MTIYCEDTDQMLEVTYGLVEKGLMFETRPAHGGWLITLTGGY